RAGCRHGPGPPQLRDVRYDQGGHRQRDGQGTPVDQPARLHPARRKGRARARRRMEHGNGRADVPLCARLAAFVAEGGHAGQGHSQPVAQWPARRRRARRRHRRRPPDRHQPMKAWHAAALAAACLTCSGPVAAQKSDPERVAAFAELPYWPGYWVREQYANTTIGGIAAPRDASSQPIRRLNGFDAPWNEEGKRRQAEAARLRGGRKALGWGYPMMMDAATPLQFMITPEETMVVNAYGE